MARAKRPSVPPAIHETEGFQTLPPLTRHWLESLHAVSYGSTVAWINYKRDLFEDYDNPERWSAAQIASAIAVVRPEREDLLGHLLSVVDLDEPDTPSDEAWAQALGSDGLVWTEALSLFGLTYANDLGWAPMSWEGSWDVREVTEGLGVVLVNDDFRNNHIFPLPLAVIDRRDAVRSAAVALAHAPIADGAFDRSGEIFSELHAHGLTDEEVYLLLLAQSAPDLEPILNLPRARLRTYSPRWARNGFKRVAAALHKWDAPNGDGDAVGIRDAAR